MSHSSGSVSFSDSYTVSNGEAKSTAWSSDGNYVLAGSGGTSASVTLLSHSSGSLSFADSYLNTSNRQANGVAFTPDGSYIADAYPNTSPYFNLLDHTTAGSLSLATTYTLASDGWNAVFSPN